MKEIDKKEFDRLYYRDVLPLLKTCDMQRGKSRNILVLFLSIGIIFPLLSHYPIIINNGIIIIGVALFLWFLAHLGSSSYRDYKSSYAEMKNRLYPRIFNLFGMEYISKENNLKAYSLYKDVLRQLGINKKIDDIVKGEYKGNPFVVIEYEYSAGKSHFKRVIFATKINKNITGNVYISSIGLGYSSKNVQRVTLEDAEFNEMFEVSSNDQVQARYLLTPTFMERLKKYQENKNYIDVHFTRKTYLDNNIFFFISSGNDFFEISDKESFWDKENYYKFYTEIKDILEIVDALKLDMNIGL